MRPCLTLSAILLCLPGCLDWSRSPVTIDGAPDAPGSSDAPAVPDHPKVENDGSANDLPWSVDQPALQGTLCPGSKGSIETNIPPAPGATLTLWASWPEPVAWVMARVTAAGEASDANWVGMEIANCDKSGCRWTFQVQVPSVSGPYQFQFKADACNPCLLPQFGGQQEASAGKLLISCQP